MRDDVRTLCSSDSRNHKQKLIVISNLILKYNLIKVCDIVKLS